MVAKIGAFVNFNHKVRNYLKLEKKVERKQMVSKNLKSFDLYMIKLKVCVFAHRNLEICDKAKI